MRNPVNVVYGCLLMLQQMIRRSTTAPTLAFSLLADDCKKRRCWLWRNTLRRLFVVEFFIAARYQMRWTSFRFDILLKISRSQYQKSHLHESVLAQVIECAYRHSQVAKDAVCTA